MTIVERNIGDRQIGCLERNNAAKIDFNMIVIEVSKVWVIIVVEFNCKDLVMVASITEDAKPRSRPSNSELIRYDDEGKTIASTF